MNKNLGLLIAFAVLMITACNPTMLGGYGSNAYYPQMMNRSPMGMGMNPGFGQQPFGNGFNAMQGNFGMNPLMPAIMRGPQRCNQFDLANQPDCINLMLTADNAMNMAAMNTNMGMMPMQQTAQVIDLQTGTTATPGAVATGSNEIQELQRNVRDISRVIAGRNPQRRR